MTQHGRRCRRAISRGLAGLIAISAFAGAAMADQVADFYKGKQMRMIIRPRRSSGPRSRR